MLGDFFTDVGHDAGDTYETDHESWAVTVAELPVDSSVDSVWDDIVDRFDGGPAMAVPEADVGTWEPGMLVADAGDPGGDAEHWHYQGNEGACAVVAQGSIIEDITGYDFDQAEATGWLADHGWYDPATGTMPEDLTRLLDAYGVPNEMGYYPVTDLYDALANGDKVMVALDANEIWFPADDPATGMPAEQTDGGHAVWVTDIGYDPDDMEWKVVLNDSGHEDGRACVVSLDDFVNAYDDFGNLAVIADPEGYVPAPAPF